MTQYIFRLNNTHPPGPVMVQYASPERAQYVNPERAKYISPEGAPYTKKPLKIRGLNKICRDDWIRTSDPQHPMLIRYQAALRPEKRCKNKINFPNSTRNCDNSHRFTQCNLKLIPSDHFRASSSCAYPFWACASPSTHQQQEFLRMSSSHELKS